MDFQSGIYGDENMPIIPTFQTIVYGTWESPLIDLSEGVNITRGVKSAWVEFESSEDEGNIEIYTTIDGNYESLEDSLYIKEARLINDNPHIKITVVIRGSLTDLLSDENPILHNLKVVVSNEDNITWEWNKF